MSWLVSPSLFSYDCLFRGNTRVSGYFSIDSKLCTSGTSTHLFNITEDNRRSFGHEVTLEHLEMFFFVFLCLEQVLLIIKICFPLLKTQPPARSRPHWAKSKRGWAIISALPNICLFKTNEGTESLQKVPVYRSQSDFWQRHGFCHLEIITVLKNLQSANKQNNPLTVAMASHLWFKNVQTPSPTKIKHSTGEPLTFSNDSSLGRLARFLKSILGIDPQPMCIMLCSISIDLFNVNHGFCSDSHS